MAKRIVVALALVATGLLPSTGNAQANKDQPRVVAKDATILYAAGENTRAIARLQEAIALAPTLVEAHLLRAAAEERREQLDAAEQTLLAAALKPDYWEAINRKGLLCRLAATLEADPAKKDALTRQAQELLQRGIALQTSQQEKR